MLEKIITSTSIIFPNNVCIENGYIYDKTTDLRLDVNTLKFSKINDLEKQLNGFLLINLVEKNIVFKILKSLIPLGCNYRYSIDENRHLAYKLIYLFKLMFKQTLVILVFILMVVNLLFLYVDLSYYLFILKNFAIIYINILLSIYLHETGHLIKTFIKKEKSDVIFSGFSLSVLISNKMKDDFLTLFLGPFIPVIIGLCMLIISNNRHIGNNLEINLYFISFIYLVHFINFFPFTTDGRNMFKYQFKKNP